jgi:2-keto-4-pentenoate hydratase/2-oxohepta-3-ene-1,7-dioic acid hydratase in catechol pathway
MRLVRFAWAEGSRWGEVQGDDRVVEVEGDPYSGWQTTRRTHRLADLKLLPPCNPSKMIIVGWNYAAHAQEANAKPPLAPLFYPLAAGSLIAHEEPVVYPPEVERVDHEAELVVVIGRTARRVSQEDAEHYIAGYTCGNDVSARDFQWNRADENIPRAKTVDTFSPVGPWLVPHLDHRRLAVEMRVNGQIRQSAHTSDMVFSVARLMADISRFVTLLPGDIIFTGTPEGISPVKVGDIMEVTIEGIGTLRNQVIAE